MEIADPFRTNPYISSCQPTVYVSSGTTFLGCGEGKVMFADLDWDSVQLQNGIARFMIEKGYGCSTDALPGRSIPLWESLVDGKVHVMMEAWLPNYNPWWEKGLDEGSIIPLGKSLDDNWQSTFVVPTYVVEQNPGLNSVKDLPGYIDLFKTRRSGEKIRLVNCLAGWACSAINKEKVKAYGLDQIIYLEEFKSEDAFSGSLEEAYEDREPWLGYMWGPTPLATKLELTRLEEPPYTEACWNSDKACKYPVSKVRIVVYPGLLERAPGVMEFLRRWDLDTDTQVAVEERYSETGDYAETVTWFLKNREDVWIRWVTPDVSEKIRAVLTQQ